MSLSIEHKNSSWVTLAVGCCCTQQLHTKQVTSIILYLYYKGSFALFHKGDQGYFLSVAPEFHPSGKKFSSVRVQLVLQTIMVFCFKQFVMEKSYFCLKIYTDLQSSIFTGKVLSKSATHWVLIANFIT